MSIKESILLERWHFFGWIGNFNCLRRNVSGCSWYHELARWVCKGVFLFFISLLAHLFKLSSIIIIGLILTVNAYNLQIIASENQPVRWTTPLGLPVVQPYRKLGRHTVSGVFLITWWKLECLSSQFHLFWSIEFQVKTSLQILTLQRETEKVLCLLLTLFFTS